MVEIRECVTVEVIGVLFSREVFVAPFRFPDERDYFIDLMVKVFGMERPDETD